MPAPVAYTPRIALPELIVREQANTLILEVERDGGLVAPTSGTVDVFKADGTALVDNQAVTISSDRAEYTIAAVTLPSTLDFSRLYQVRWKLVMPDGNTHTFVRMAWLVRFRWYAVVAVQDLEDEFHEVLAYTKQGGDPQPAIDASFKRLIRRILNEGRDPALILSPGALRAPLLHLAAATLFRGWTREADDLHWTNYKDQLTLYEREFGRMKLVEDLDEDGVPEDGETGRPASTVISTGIGNPAGGPFTIPASRGS